MSELYPLMEHDPPPSPAERHRVVWLSLAIAAPPTLWILQLLLLSSFTNYACFAGEQPLTSPTGNMTWVGGLEVAAHLCAIAATVASGLISLRYFMMARDRIPEHRDGSQSFWHLDRLCFMALGGILSSTGFLGAILFEVIASAMVTPCG